MKTTRLNTGIYKIVKGTRTFEANKTYDGQWQLLELIDNSYLGLGCEFEYIEHYTDLRSCKLYVEYYC